MRSSKGDRRREAARGTLPAGAALALSLGLQPAAARADSLEVTNLDDSGPGSLRDAIAAANGDPHSVITFHSGLSGTIVLTSGQLSLRQSMDILGPGADVLAVDGNAASHVFYAYSHVRDVALDVTISGLKITGGNHGACVSNRGSRLLLESVTVVECASGGVATGESAAELTIRHSAIADNMGSAISVWGSVSGGTVVVQDSAITSNDATEGAGIYDFGSRDFTIERTIISGNTGSAIFRRGGKLMTIRQSAITNNGGDAIKTPHPSSVGGTRIQDSTIADNAGCALSLYIGSASIERSTISGNVGCGIYIRYDTPTITSSIIAGNGTPSRPDLENSDGHAMRVRGFKVGYSLIGDPGDANVTELGPNLIGQDPQLGALGDHGGPTPTRVPGPASPVIDAGDPTFAPPAGAVDQRGVSRVVGARIDMGAVERSAGVLQCAAPALSVSEDAGNIAVSVTRTGGFDGAASVDIATADGSATQPDDYTQSMAALQWSDGESAPKTLSVPIVGDGAAEPNETFSAVLSNASGAALGANASVSVTIHDHDSDSDVAPTIAGVDDQITDEDTAIAAIQLTIADADDGAQALVVTAASANQALIADADLVISGAGTSRTLEISPSKNANGNTDVTVAVSDGVKTGKITFNVLVNPVDDPPTISIIPRSSSVQFEAVVISFGIDDVDDDVSALSVSATSSNQPLAPDENVEPGGSGAHRTITVEPAAGVPHNPTMALYTNITVQVSDGTAIATRTFPVEWTPFTGPIEDAGPVEDAGPGSDAGEGTTRADGGAPADAGPHAGEHDAGARPHHGHDAGAAMQHADASASERDANAGGGRAGEDALADGGTTDAGPRVTVNDDCGCTTVGASRPASRVVLSALLGVLGLASRRRRRAR